MLKPYWFPSPKKNYNKKLQDAYGNPLTSPLFHPNPWFVRRSLRIQHALQRDRLLASPCRVTKEDAYVRLEFLTKCHSPGSHANCVTFNIVKSFHWPTFANGEKSWLHSLKPLVPMWHAITLIHCKSPWPTPLSPPLRNLSSPNFKTLQ